MELWNFLGTFPKVQFFGNFVGTFCVKNILDFVRPPLFSTQNSKIVGAQKVSQNFCIVSETRPPSPLMEETQIKAEFPAKKRP